MNPSIERAPVVRVRDLTVAYGTEVDAVPVVDGIDFDIAAGESFGLVGESGSGKSTIALALTRYLPASARVAARTLTVGGQAVLDLDRGALRRLRADRISVVYQEPALALNPTSTIGAQLAEVFRLRGASPREARSQTIASLEVVGLPEPVSIVRRFPHELSGGQQQRVVIAMALASQPELLILDEPTTGLDSNVERDILALIDRLQRVHGFATLLISHNLPLVAAHCSRVGVLQAGRMVETAHAGDLLQRATHPYTRALVDALPDIDRPRSRPRIEVHPRAAAAGRTEWNRPGAEPGVTPLVRIDTVSKRYGQKLVLDEVSLTIGPGEVLGLVGESGSGKTTLGRAIAGLTPYDGRIDLAPEVSERPVQLVFQSPDASLNPRRTVRQTLSRSIELLGGDTDASALAESAGIDRSLLDQLPHELSGGQKQRVAIARAFAGPVPLVVCDEPTSALDVSVQARILDLLTELHERTGVSYLFISHDLAVVRRIADRIAVLRHGRLVEVDEVEAVFGGGRHEYTESLLHSARELRRDPRSRTDVGAVA